MELLGTVAGCSVNMLTPPMPKTVSLRAIPSKSVPFISYIGALAFLVIPTLS